MHYLCALQLYTMNKYFLMVCFLFIVTNVLGQAAADTGKVQGMSPIKTMSYEQYKAYVDGADQFNMALVAQLNGFPDPEKVIALKKELALTNEQATSIEAINVELHRKMKEMGNFIVKNEKMLDDLFRTKKLDDGTLIYYTNRYGLYQGETRNAILQAYLKVRNILSVEQRTKYQQLQKSQH
jgi:Spy/CpxP family protein refolding chaperone